MGQVLALFAILSFTSASAALAQGVPPILIPAPPAPALPPLVAPAPVPSVVTPLPTPSYGVPPGVTGTPFYGTSRSRYIYRGSEVRKPKKNRWKKRRYRYESSGLAEQ